MSLIKIVSGWSNPGGSTVHFIELCNLLNDNGFNCTFYGPHDWHLDKCRSDTVDKVSLDEGDILVSHFLKIRNKVKKHILSCHETNMFPLKEMDLQRYDLIHFVSNFQKKWHSVNHPSVIIPPVVEKVKWKDPKSNIAAVIGSIDSHKQTDKSIYRALTDGYDQVHIYGAMTDPVYYKDKVLHFVESEAAVLKGVVCNRRKMYKHVSKVYHSSIRETYGLVEAECKLAGIPFDGPSNNQDILDKSEILERWKKILV